MSSKPSKAPADRKSRKPKGAPLWEPNAPEAVSVTMPDSTWTRDRLFARLAVDGSLATALTIQTYAQGHLGEHGSVQQTVDSLRDKIAASQQGSTAMADELLIGQAVTLNTLFNELLRRAALNMGEYPEAMERYMRLAFKAQSQGRATLESLSKIKNPATVSFVKQANIANGPQQVNNGVMPEPQAAARTTETGTAPIELLESSNGEWVDSRATGAASRGDPEMAAVGKVERT